MFYPVVGLGARRALVMAWNRRQVDPAAGFLLGWIVGPMLVLECVRTKLIHYYLPSYPGLRHPGRLAPGWTVAVRVGMAG